jgi:hypothetical protein
MELDENKSKGASWSLEDDDDEEEEGQILPDKSEIRKFTLFNCIYHFS